MTPDKIALIVMALIQHGPEMARAILTLFQKETQSQADWELLFSTYKKPYEAYTAPLPTIPGTTGGNPGTTTLTGIGGIGSS